MRVLAMKKSTARRLGIAAVEFAIVLPVFTIFIIGMLEIGRMIMVREMLNDAARKGARTGIQRDKGNSDITADAVDVMEHDNKIPTGKTNVVITVKDPSGTTLTDSLNAVSGSTVTVQVQVQAQYVSWIQSYMFYGSTTYDSETVVMMKQ